MNRHEIATRERAPAIRTTPKRRFIDETVRTQNVDHGTALDATTGDGVDSRGGSMRGPMVFSRAPARAAARTHPDAAMKTPTCR
jgi:hypothetical protein